MRININAGLKTPNLVSVSHQMFNGCSGNAYILTNGANQVRSDPWSEPRFQRDQNINFWDLLLGAYGYNEGKPGTNRRLMVIYPPQDVRLPSPNAWFNPPEEFASYYLKCDDDVLAVLGAANPAHFSDEKSPAALFLSDPEKYVSLAHLESAGMYHRSAVVRAGERSGQVRDLRARGDGSQVRISGTTNEVADVSLLSTEWSREISWMNALPWWERFRLRNTKYPDSEAIVNAVVSFCTGKEFSESYNGLRHISGNAAVRGPLDSFRAVFCFHSLNPAATLDLEATPSVMSQDGKKTLYYKVLPFYYHSPQHADHRVATCFLSERPIHLERIS